jgi:hypothetical protein
MLTGKILDLQIVLKPYRSFTGRFSRVATGVHGPARDTKPTVYRGRIWSPLYASVDAEFSFIMDLHTSLNIAVYHLFFLHVAIVVSRILRILTLTRGLADFR